MPEINTNISNEDLNEKIITLQNEIFGEEGYIEDFEPEDVEDVEKKIENLNKRFGAFLELKDERELLKKVEGLDPDEKKNFLKKLAENISEKLKK